MDGQLFKARGEGKRGGEREKERERVSLHAVDVTIKPLIHMIRIRGHLQTEFSVLNVIVGVGGGGGGGGGGG